MPFKTWMGLLLCVLGMVLTAQLGAWQLRRAAEQDQRWAQMQGNSKQRPLQQLPCFTAQQTQAPQIQALQYRPVHLRGHFLPNTLVYIDNRQVQGRSAVQVVQAFVLETPADPGQTQANSGCIVAVDRGYLLRNPAAPRQVPVSPVATQSSQPLSLQGWVVMALPRSAELRSWFGADTQGLESTHQEHVQGQWLWSNLQPSTYAQHLKRLGIGQPVLPFFVTQQTQDVRPSTTPQQATHALQATHGFWHQALLVPNKADKHRAYAAQWYGLCAVLGVALATFLVRKCLKITKTFNS